MKTIILTQFKSDGEICCFCGQPITTKQLPLHHPDSGLWHHYDESLKKTDPKLYKQTLGTKNGFTVPCHRKCHDSHHHKGQQTCLGRVWTEDMRRRVAEGNKGKHSIGVISEDTRSKMSESAKKRPCNRKGIKLSIEVRERMKQAQLKRRLSNA